MPEPSRSGIALGQPREALGLAVESDGAQRQAFASQRAAERGELRSELGADVADDSIVGGRGAAEDRNLRPGEPIDKATDAPIVRTEVVSPVGDAVHFVDDDQTGREPTIGMITSANSGLASRSGDTSRRSTASSCRRLRNSPMVVDGRGVDGHATQPEPFRSLDLVPHQRQER